MRKIIADFDFRCPVVMAAILFIFAGLSFLLSFFGYVLVLFQVFAILLGIIVSGLMIFLAYIGGTQGEEQTRVSRILSAFLPALALFFVIQAMDAVHMNRFLYAMLAAIILTCSLILFFSCIRTVGIKIGLSIPYGLVIVPVILILFIRGLGSFLPPFGHREVMETVYSPSASYRAEIIAHSQGALGGNTEVVVIPNSSHMRILIGELQVRPRRIYSGRWGEFGHMSLRFETDERLYIYRAYDRIVLQQGRRNRWVRE